MNNAKPAIRNMHVASSNFERTDKCLHLILLFCLYCPSQSFPFGSAINFPLASLVDISKCISEVKDPPSYTKQQFPSNNISSDHTVRDISYIVLNYS